MSPSKTGPTRYMFFVLGIYQSGASTLTGVLNLLGATLTKELAEAIERAPKGHFEGASTCRLNQAFLASTGSCWNGWRPISPSWLTSLDGQVTLPQMQELLTEEFSNAPLAVLKDPRMCRMVPFWQQAAESSGYEVLPILIHRNPLEVAKSLQARDGTPLSEGLLIWLRHVLDAEFTTRNTTRFITSYHNVLTNCSAQVSGLERTFDLAFPNRDENASAKIDAFLSPELRHYSESPESVMKDETLSPWVRDTYEILERWTQKKELKRDHSALDRIRKEFDNATLTFSQVASPDRFAQGTAQDCDAAIEGIQTTAAMSIHALKAEALALKSEIAIRDVSYAEKETEYNKLLNTLDEKDKAHASLKVDVKRLIKRLAETKEALDRRTLEMENIAQCAQEAETALAAAVTKISRMNKRLVEKNQKLASQVTQIDQINANMATLENSTFWRMSKPLRTCVAALRQMFS